MVEPLLNAALSLGIVVVLARRGKKSLTQCFKSHAKEQDATKTARKTQSVSTVLWRYTTSFFVGNPELDTSRGCVCC